MFLKLAHQRTMKSVSCIQDTLLLDYYGWGLIILIFDIYLPRYGGLVMDSDFLVLDSLLAVNGSFVAMQVHLEIAVGNSGFLFVVVFVVMTAMLSGL